MAVLTGNLFKYNMVYGYFNGITVKAKLMASGFAFSRATMTKWADASDSEMPTANGYTQGGVSLSGIAIAEDDTNHKVTVKWTSPAWAVTPGNLGPMSGCMLINDTATDKDIIQYIPFSPEQTQPTGGTFTVQNVEYDQVDTITAV